MNKFGMASKWQKSALVFICLAIMIISLFLVQTSSVNAQAQPGAIAFVGFNVDSNDGFAFVLLTGSNADSIIYFTDNEWTGSALNTGEGTVQWTAPSSALPAGTVVTINDAGATPTASHGSATRIGAFNLSGSNEALFAFQGANETTPTIFLAAISNEDYASANATLTGTGLTEGTTAVNIDGDEDVAVYVGVTTGFTDEASAHAAIGNAANWATQDGGGDQSQDLTIPDFPDDVPASFTISSPTAVTLSSTSTATTTYVGIALATLLLALAGLVVLQKRQA